MAGSCGESKKTDSYTEGQNPVTGTPIAVPPTPTAAGRRRRRGMPAGARDQVPSPDRGPGRQDLRVQALLQQRAWRLQPKQI